MREPRICKDVEGESRRDLRSGLLQVCHDFRDKTYVASVMLLFVETLYLLLKVRPG